MRNGGRGRKIQAEGLPPGFNSLPRAQRTKILRSQGAAKLYKRSKIVSEIENRVGDGDDRYEATAAVLTLAAVQYRQDGQDPPWDIMEAVRSDVLAPVLLALERLKATPIVQNNTERDKKLVSKPSVVAHSRPLRAAELESVEVFLRSRIDVLQMVPIEGTAPVIATGTSPQIDDGQAADDQAGSNHNGARPLSPSHQRLAEESGRGRRKKLFLADPRPVPPGRQCQMRARTA